MKKNKKKDYVKIGILGGTFDPPHKGHLYISKIALKKLRLKKILWIITKKNPLKNKPYLKLKERMKLSKEITRKNKKISIKYFDEKIRSTSTFNLLNYIKMKIATEKDWKTEYLSPTISVKSVNGVEDAINHINKYGSLHTDSIVTKNKKTAKKFLSSINSSIAVHNASTQFADGGEFGFGAEVGISTSKLHPRGPIGLDQLTTYKYILEGKGQIRK